MVRSLAFSVEREMARTAREAKGQTYRLASPSSPSARFRRPFFGSFFGRTKKERKEKSNMIVFDKFNVRSLCSRTKKEPYYGSKFDKIQVGLSFKDKSLEKTG